MTYDVSANPLHHIALTSFGLGAVAGMSVVALLAGVGARAAAYVVVMAVFHVVEFVSTSRQKTVNSRLFLVVGNRGLREMWIVHAVSLLEHWRYRWHYCSLWWGVTAGGIGIGIRWQAMRDCGAAFSHYIDTVRSSGHRLVTDGIYAHMRHPSYLGFYVMVIGAQVALGNVLSLMACVMVLTRFFRRRVQFEEHFLLKFYGTQYRQYMQRTPSGIPFV